MNFLNPQTMKQNLKIRIKRVIALFVDVALITLVVYMLDLAIGWIFNVRLGDSPLYTVWLMLMMFKDVFQGMSLGKRLLGIQVVDCNKHQAASPVKCIFRNLFYPLATIDLFVWLFSHEQRRIGDYIVSSRVAPYEETLPHASAVQSWRAIGIATLIIVLLQGIVYYMAYTSGLLPLLLFE